MEPGLQWRSLQWPDGSLYEGLTKDGVCHSHGVMHYANGDRYEGEFMKGKQNGYGVYVWSDGMIYRGEWMEGTTHGCGMQLWREQDKRFSVRGGKFLAGEYIGPVLTCSTEASSSVAVEADYAATLARSLQTDKGQQRQLAMRARNTLGKPDPPTNSLPWPFSLFAPKQPSAPKPTATIPPGPRLTTPPPGSSPQPPFPTAPSNQGQASSSTYSKLAPQEQQALARAVEHLVAREINALPQLPAGGPAR